MMRTFDPISIIERGYETSGSGVCWTRKMAATITESLDPERLGTLAYFLTNEGPTEPLWVARDREDFDEPTIFRLFSSVLGALNEEEQGRLLQALRHPGVHCLRQIFGGTDLDPSGTEPMKRMVEAIRRIISFERVQESVVVAVETAAPIRPIFVTNVETRTTFDLPTRKIWSFMAVHLGAAFRLASAARDPNAPDVESVLTPGGRVLSASGPAAKREGQEQLREAVKRVDRVRSRQGRSDPLLALETWSGLFAGRWSLVEHFDSDGRRFLLARRNDPSIDHASQLTLRQRQVLFYSALGWSNQEISYTLGLAENTVSAHAKKGLAKLGLTSRAELVHLNTQLTAGAARSSVQLSPR